MKRKNRWIGACGSALLALYAFNCPAIQAEEYVIHSNDKLKLKIFQYPELNGEYEVDANGTISLADIGEIPVDGLSTKDIANLISQRLIRAGLSSKPGTSVEVLQSRPVYVLGDVQKPGEYTFRPGVTVLQVVSLAGGWLRFNDPGLVRIERDVITVKGEMRHLVRRRFQLIARRALLNAELKNVHEVQFPESLVRQAGNDSALTQLLDEERSLLKIRSRGGGEGTRQPEANPRFVSARDRSRVAPNEGQPSPIRQRRRRTQEHQCAGGEGPHDGQPRDGPAAHAATNRDEISKGFRPWFCARSKL